MKQLLAIILMSICVSLSYAASFNCLGDLNKVENLICQDSEISALDDELGALYKYMQPRKIEIEDQNKWIKERNKCNERECVVNLYRDRIRLYSDHRIPIKECLQNKDEIVSYQNKISTGSSFDLEKELDLDGDGKNEAVFMSWGCGTVGCEYLIYSFYSGCAKETLSFTSREYFHLSNNKFIATEYFDNKEIDVYKRTGEISNTCYSYLIVNVEGDISASAPRYALYCYKANK